jgi:uncharacterized protein
MDALSVLAFQNRSLRRPFPWTFIDREASPVLSSKLRPDAAVVLVGARQTGKTSLARRLIHERDETLGQDRSLYLNMDSGELRQAFASPVELALYLERQGYGGGDLVVIDEAQRLPESGLYVKQLVDAGMGIAWLVSGSASLTIRSETREHLTGRRALLELAPLSARELARHQGLLNAEGEPGGAPERQAVEHLVEDLAVFGGYPAVWTSPAGEDRSDIISQIYEDYVRRDVVDFLRVQNTAGFNDLVRALAGQVGGMLNHAEVSRTVGIDVRTVRAYLDILEQTYVVRLLQPFSTNPRGEIRKQPKVAFHDNGILNASRGAFMPLSGRVDRGALIENLVFSALAGATRDARAWRTAAGAEVDLVLGPLEAPVPVEVKAAVLKRPRVSRGYRSFIATYRPDRAYVVHRGEKMVSRIEDTEVIHLPLTDALLGRIDPP